MLLRKQRLCSLLNSLLQLIAASPMWHIPHVKKDRREYYFDSVPFLFFESLLSQQSIFQLRVHLILLITISLRPVVLPTTSASSSNHPDRLYSQTNKITYPTLLHFLELSGLYLLASGCGFLSAVNSRRKIMPFISNSKPNVLSHTKSGHRYPLGLNKNVSQHCLFSSTRKLLSKHRRNIAAHSLSGF